MSMTTVSNLSGEAGRTFAIEVTGSPSQAMLRTGTHTIRVPYSSLSQTIHSIGQRGGKVVNVTMLSTAFTALEDISVAAEVVVGSDPVVVPQTPEKASVAVKSESRRQKSKSKKR